MSERRSPPSSEPQPPGRALRPPRLDLEKADAIFRKMHDSPLIFVGIGAAGSSVSPSMPPDHSLREPPR
jgi:hypothetical protein